MNKNKKVCLIYSTNTLNYIGKDNKLLWDIPEDLVFFKNTTLHDTVVMGRKTWESLPSSVKPLPGRTNIVLSRKSKDELTDITDTGAIVCSSIEEAISIAKTTVWVIGGGEVYRQALSFADYLYVTKVENEVTGDVRGPVIDPDVFVLDTVYPKRRSRNSYYQHRIYRKLKN